MWAPEAPHHSQQSRPSGPAGSYCGAQPGSIGRAESGWLLLGSAGTVESTAVQDVRKIILNYNQHVGQTGARLNTTRFIYTIILTIMKCY